MGRLFLDSSAQSSQENGADWQEETYQKMDNNGDDWRKYLAAESRERIVKKIAETLERHLPFSGPEGLQELREIALRFEERIFLGASSQPDYLRKISFTMLTMESRSQNSVTNAMPPNSAGNDTP